MPQARQWFLMASLYLLDISVSYDSVATSNNQRVCDTTQQAIQAPWSDETRVILGCNHSSQISDVDIYL